MFLSALTISDLSEAFCEGGELQHEPSCLALVRVGFIDMGHVFIQIVTLQAASTAATVGAMAMMTAIAHRMVHLWVS